MRRPSTCLHRIPPGCPSARGEDNAKDLGVLNIAGALPFTLALALAPAALTTGGGSYGVLYAVAGACPVVGAVAILPVRRAR